MNKFIIGLLLAFSIISNGFAADRPKLVGLEILLSKYDATDDSSYMLDVLQRCSGLSITLSSLMDNQDKKQADSYMLASIRALNAANVIKEKSNINGSGTTTAEEQNLVGIKIYADAYKSWLDANKMELGYYFMDDEKFKREMTLCIQIIKDLP